MPGQNVCKLTRGPIHAIYIGTCVIDGIDTDAGPEAKPDPHDDAFAAPCRSTGFDMIVDVHTHLFPKSVREHRAKYLGDEPAFELLYKSESAKMVGTEDLIASMDENGVDVSVVCGFPWMNEKNCMDHNDYILEAIATYPDRLKGLCSFNPFTRDSEKEVERCLDKGFSGVGEVAFYTGGGITGEAVAHMAPVMAMCRSRNLPVLIHTNEPVGHEYPGKSGNTLAQIYNLVKTYPDNTLILGHWGGGIFFYTLLKKEVRDVLKNVYYDTAASCFLYRPDIYRVAAELAGEDKILFGTDYPLIGPKRYYGEIEEAGLDEPARKKLMGGNAAALFGITAEKP